MMKIIALNEVTNNENEDEYNNLLSKEAQEQVALNEYNRALNLLIGNKKIQALNVLIELLNTDLLDKVDKPQVRDGRSRPMLSLKYSCFKNVASIHAELKNYNEALYNYWEAINLDDSDVVLWYRIGMMATKIFNLDIACFAYKQGLKRNSNHWPCLDNIITVLYAIPDFMNCLLYISIALERDPTYIKGLAFRQKIFNSIPSFQECYKIYNSSWMRDPLLNIKYDQEEGNLFINQANELKNKWINISKGQIKHISVVDLALRRVLSQYSWLDLGKSLIDMHNYIIENNLNFISRITLKFDKWSDPKSLHNTSQGYSTEIYCTKKISVQNTFYLSNKKKTDSNNSFMKNNFLMSVNNNSDLIEVINHQNKSTPYKNEPVIEENTIVPLDAFIVRDSDDSNTNCLESVKDKNLNYTKFNYKYLNEKKKDVNNTNFEEVKNNLDSKPFENDKITAKDKKDKSQTVKKRRRSSLCFLTQWAWSNSNIKRSSRARNSGRKDYERGGVLLEETFKQIFPSTLLPDNTKFTRKEFLKCIDDSIDETDLCNITTNNGSIFTEDINLESSKSTNTVNEDQIQYFGFEQEKIDVIEFVKQHTKKSNLLITIIKFIEFLCNKWNTQWPEELREVYIQLYIRVREHIPHTSPFVENGNDCILKIDTEATLLFCELYTDKWISCKPCKLSTCSVNTLGIGILSEDIGYMIFSHSRDEAYTEKNINFLLRSLWIKANVFLYQGDIEIALKTLELLLQHIQQIEVEIYKPFLKLINCKYNSTINMRNVQKMLTYIQRGKKFCKIKYLYREKKYEELSNILKETFNFSKDENHFLLCNEEPVDRAEHFQILLDTLWQLQQHEDCYVWAEVCLNESWYNYLLSIDVYSNEEERIKWMCSVLYTLEKLEACVVEVSTFIVKYLSDSRRSRLVQNLVHIVYHQLNILDNTPSITIESVSPWIILHFILQYEEDKQRARSVRALKYKLPTIENSDEDDDEDFPASVTILLKAHEFLGRHGWCCINEGKLLLFILKFIIPRLQFPLYASFKQKLREAVEQVIYCLYGHPSKFNSGSRSKPKYIEEHIKTSINLSWETCQLLFEFYKPETLPSFESKRVDSINIDTVVLFKKICTFIPVDSDPTKIVEEMNSYLLGNNNRIPSVRKLLPNNISCIYYLIADHYFKAVSNQSWSSASKYYILDLCLHPNDLNSWAGLAMSTSTLMETWLNNFQPNIII